MNKYFSLTPPTTPDLPDDDSDPPRPKTPRKLALPQWSSPPDAVILRFELLPVTQTAPPKLVISVREQKHKRMLWGKCRQVNTVSTVGRKRMKFGSQSNSTDYEGTDEEDSDFDQYSNTSTPTISKLKPPKLKPPSTHKGGKVCASCKTRKTPLWRDAEDGTPYCNACGIRFKKYRIRCSECSYIPRKDERVGNTCCVCGCRLVYVKKYC